jgi:raffinose/stachyose/melibiose transport system substrate-binding protein
MLARWLGHGHHAERPIHQLTMPEGVHTLQRLAILWGRTPVPGAERAEVFEIGSFNFPSMTGELVDAPARTIEVNIGFWGIPKKDQAQNDLEVDFLMFMTSPQGYGLYLRNKLDPNNLNGGISGPPVVKNVSLPQVYQERFANIEFIGNQQKPGPGNWRCRGVADYQPTVRTWVDLNQQYFSGELETDEFLDACQANIMDNFEEVLVEHLRWAEGLEALDTPEKQPEKIE